MKLPGDGAGAGGCGRRIGSGSVQIRGWQRLESSGLVAKGFDDWGTVRVAVPFLVFQEGSAACRAGMVPGRPTAGKPVGVLLTLSAASAPRTSKRTPLA